MSDLDLSDPLELLDPVCRLETPIKISNIMNKCTDFSIKSLNDEIEREEEMDITQVYSYDKLEPYCLLENLDVESDTEDDNLDNMQIENPSKSFPYFRKKMAKISEDGKILKMIEKQGIGEDRSYVGKFIAYVHYAAYVELAEYPFDITRLRHKKPFKIKLGRGEVIPGFEIAIKSMKKLEKSKFLIHPDLAYREMGVPPRIPPNATILFDVELLDICEDAVLYDNINEKELPAKFEDNILIARNLRTRGNKQKLVEKNFNGALHTYRKALYIVIQSHYANDEEENLAKEEMIKLYTNMAICYMLKQDYKKVCIMYNEAKNDCNKLAESNIRLLYNSAKALRHLGSFDEASKRLKKILRITPNQESVIKEFELLEEARDKHLKEEKMSCRKMFGFYRKEDCNLDNEDEDYSIEHVGDDFMQLFNEELNVFKKSDDKKMILRWECTAAEKEFCRKQCKREKLNLKFNELENSSILNITKNEF